MSETKNKVIDAFSRHIGDRIQHFRRQQDLSLSELSRRSGIAKGTLSRLEAGNGNPTIMTLGALAGILNVTPGDFIEQVGTTPQERSQRHDLAGPSLRMLFVHRVVAATTWDVYDATVPVMREPLHSSTHGGTEHILMIEGRLQVGLTAAPVVLGAGEHVSFPGSEPHLYFPIEGPCRMLLIMEYARSGPGARRSSGEDTP